MCTALTIYAFVSEEHLYSDSGSNQGNTYYYSLGGRLVAAFSANVSTGSIYLTDALGSVLFTFSNTAGSAALLYNQVYSPYGTQRYYKDCSCQKHFPTHIQQPQKEPSLSLE